MAYDAEGNYEFNPMVDSADAADQADLDNTKRLIRQAEKAGKEIEEEKNMQAQNQFSNSMWQATCEADGIKSPAELEQIKQVDPDRYNNIIVGYHQNMAESIKGASKEATPTATVKAPQRKVVDNSSRETLDRLKEISNKRPLTEDEEQAGVEATLKGTGI